MVPTNTSLPSTDVTGQYQLVTGHYQVVTGHYQVMIDQYQVVNGHYAIVHGHYQVVTLPSSLWSVPSSQWAQPRVHWSVPSSTLSVRRKSWSHKTMILVTKRVAVDPFELKLSPNGYYGRPASFSTLPEPKTPVFEPTSRFRSLGVGGMGAAT